MPDIALVTDAESLPIDYDMPPILEIAEEIGLSVKVCEWDDPEVDWSSFETVLLRSPWTYATRLAEFLAWCKRVSKVTRLSNPLDAVLWGLDKHYLGDLARHGVPTVPTRFVEADADQPDVDLEAFMGDHPNAREFVVKPTIGAYSRNVKRFRRDRKDEASDYLRSLIDAGSSVILQPYFESIDALGETDLIYFNGTFSHAIRKGALLMPDGTVNVPTADFRKARDPDKVEKDVAEAALRAASVHLGHDAPLFYARIDLIRDPLGAPVVLEMEISEPSLSLPFCEGSARRFVKAIAKEFGGVRAERERADANA
ncbi:MAG: hypothetical protein CMO01_00745 [Thalassobius sp.]|nr:hypothetical protein [Thalassovita sp.]